jgi:hypothetical protein
MDDASRVNTVRIVNPVAPRRPAEVIALARRLDSLAGKSIGFIDNFKPNVGPFLDRIEALIRADHPEVQTHRVRKDAQASYIIADRLAGKVDAVVNAWGD